MNGWMFRRSCEKCIQVTILSEDRRMMNYWYYEFNLNASANKPLKPSIKKITNEWPKIFIRNEVMMRDMVKKMIATGCERFVIFITTNRAAESR